VQPDFRQQLKRSRLAVAQETNKVNKMMSRFSAILSGLLLSGSVLAQGLGGIEEPPRPPRIDPHPSVGNGTQGAQVWEEYGKAFKSRNSVAAMDASIFGDEVNLANGALSFSVTDISVPGNSSLPVAITRTLSVTSRPFDSDNDRPFADWELDIPRLEGVYATIWTAGSAESQQRCDITAPPKAMNRPGGTSTYTFEPDQYWSGVTAHMPSGGELLVADVANTPRPILPKGDPNHGDPNPAYKWVTPGYTYFECMNNIANPGGGISGQGFKAITPDGTTYTFNWMAQFHEAPVSNSGATLNRKRNVLYATRVENRFGHWVQYAYSNSANLPVKLTGISSSDGRNLSVLYHAGTGRIATITENASPHSRTWTYAYSSVNGWQTLTSVTLPDTRQWKLDMVNLSSSEVQYPFAAPGEPNGRNCSHNPGVQGIQSASGSIVPSTFGEITHPSGAKGRFDIEVKRHGRSNVPQFCDNVDPDDQSLLGHGDDVPVFARDYDALTLTRKTITGPALPLMEWDFSYRPNFGWLGGGWQHGQGLPPTCEGGCVVHVCLANDSNPACEPVEEATSETIVVGPRFSDNLDWNQREWSRYTHGNSFRYNEGKLLKVERGELPVGGNPDLGTVMEVTDSEFMFPTSTPPAERPIGRSLQKLGDGFVAEHPRTKTQQTIVRDGTCFRWEGFEFDDFYRAKSHVRTRLNPKPDCDNGELVSTTTETYQYWEEVQPNALVDWVIGQVQQKTNHSKLLAEEFTLHDPDTHLPLERHAFGKLQQKIQYHTSPTGTIPAGCSALVPTATGCFVGMPHKVSDPSGLKWTTFPAYVRGLPSSVQYHDTTSEVVQVNARGEIDWHRDTNNFTTNYWYDAMGRLREIAYPQQAGSPQWHKTYISFAPLTTSKFGLPAQTPTQSGSWKRTVRTGATTAINSTVTDTYYDAMWRPVVTETYELNNAGAEVPSTRSVVNTKYDPAGRQYFSAYPKRTGIINYTDSVDGRYSYFDALSRISKTSQDSEPPLRLANPLSVSYTYLDGFITEVSDQLSRKTRIHYQAYDSPTTDFPVKIESPTGIAVPQEFITTTISRDAFGKPITVSRFNPAKPGVYGSSTVTRNFYYDNHERLCKRFDPEGGATLFFYDASNNVDWQGHTTNASSACNASQVLAGDVVDFSHDARNRLIGTNYDHAQTADSTRTWTPDGLPLTVTQGDSKWTYTYNERRMLTEEKLELSGENYLFTYDYDAFGSLSSMSYPDASVVNYAPNRLGQPTGVSGYTESDSVTHHPNGALAFLTYGNGLNYNVTLNERMLPKRVTMNGVYDDIYQWDAVGNLTHIDDVSANAPQSRDRTMVYDYGNRLLEAWSSTTRPAPHIACGNPSVGIDSYCYQYDDLDNLRQQTREGVTYTYDYDDGASGRLDSLHLLGQTGAEALGYSYDSRGNVTQRRRNPIDFPYLASLPSHDFVVDKAHRTTELRTQGSSTPLESYSYDGNGKRVKIVDNASTRVQIYNLAGQFVYETSIPTASSPCSTASPANLIFCSGFEPISSGGTPSSTRYVYLAGKLIGKTRNGTTTFLHTDLLGSVVAESTQAPAQASHRPLHEPYGAPNNGANFVFTQGPDYTGHVTDAASGLSYMQARYYDPLAGRFLGVDPVHVDLGSGGNFNRYWYANNNPYRFVDPDGKFAAFMPDIENRRRCDIFFGCRIDSEIVYQSSGGRSSGSGPRRGRNEVKSTSEAVNQVQGLRLERDLRRLEPDSPLPAFVGPPASARFNQVTNDILARALSRAIDAAAARIANNHHSWSTHSREFPRVGSREGYRETIARVIRNPTHTGVGTSGQVAFLHAPSGTIVIVHPRTFEGGTAFRREQDAIQFFQNNFILD
jgi:RHS repeat-associated protein